MTARTNALSELTRFWLQARNGCLVSEAIPVKVPYEHSDIDLTAMRPDLHPWSLPDDTLITRAIIECKDEHDFDHDGQDFGKRLPNQLAFVRTIIDEHEAVQPDIQSCGDFPDALRLGIPIRLDDGKMLQL